MAHRSLFGGRDAVPAGNRGGFPSQRGQLPQEQATQVVWTTPTDGEGCQKYTEQKTICGQPIVGQNLCQEHLAIEEQRAAESARRKYNL